MPKLIDHESRKELLAEAVWDVITHDGVGAVSVRSVAKRAGVAVGSLRYMFPTRTELITFSGELTLRRATERITALPPLEDPVDYALAALRTLLPITPDTRAELLVNLALLAEAPAVPALAAIGQTLLDAVRDLCRSIVQLLHPDWSPEATDQAALKLAALVDGLALRLLASPNEDPGQALAILRAELT
jgi:AcrR family transcriptional regulator